MTKRKVVDEGVARLEHEYTSGQIGHAEYRQALTALYRERLGARSRGKRDAEVTISKEPWPGAKVRVVDRGPER